MKYLLLILPLLLSSAFAQREKIDPISFGVVKLAEERMPIDLKSFLIKEAGKYDVQGSFVKDSLQWVRLDQSLLVPRALLDMQFTAPPEHKYSWKYANQTIIPVFDAASGTYRARIFISLFESLPLKLVEEDKIVNTIRVIPPSGKRSHLIDYSCAPYSLELKGIENDFVSVGCKMQRTGKFGGEKPLLEVMLTSATYRLKDQSEPPYMMIFHESGEAKVNLVNFDGSEEVVTVKAKLPERLPRLKLAFGLGPYNLETKDKLGNRTVQIAPTAMLYGNFTLNESSSLRFFDSYSRNISTFHNWGVYFAWDLAEFCDQRCLLTSLIGAQGVDFRYSSNESSVSDIIFPQGFEFIYKHPFGKLNYKFSYGMFASFSGLYDYQNLWVRYGKTYFWELNYIEWKQEERKASMIGLSIGFPIESFF